MLSEKGIQKLDLTTAQIEQIQRLSDAEKKARSAFKEKTKQHKATMKTLIQAEFLIEKLILLQLTRDKVIELSYWC